MRACRIVPMMAVCCLSCSGTMGEPVDESKLGYRSCLGYFDCGPGSYCNQDGRCAADCRTTADCALFGRGMLCNRFGQCLSPDGDRRCSTHSDCGDNRYCNGVCTVSRASCGTHEPCPWGEGAGDVCEGRCGGHCATDNDCLRYEKELTCTPVGQCLQEGWEQWIELGKLPPTECTRDAQCRAQGWNHRCDCEKEPGAPGGWMSCVDGARSQCKPIPDFDFGCGEQLDATHFSDHDLCGTWGMRMVIGTITFGIPLIPQQPTYSSNLLLVKMNHPEGGNLKMEVKVCDIQLINFRDDDKPFADLGWMLIPYPYYRSLPILEQSVHVSSTSPGSAFTTSRSVEVRGCTLDDPAHDPLPTRADFEADPEDPRLWDQDEDGHVGMTTLMDGVLRGEAYNVQRWTAVYQGEILDDVHIRGPAHVENEQALISASKKELIYNTTTEVHPDATRTYFRMLRMQARATCADLIREGTREDSFLRHTNHLMDVPDP